MCGIIGYTGGRPAKEILLAGLRRLEYRGYDSAGICLGDGAGLSATRAVGALDRLVEAVGGVDGAATAGIGHTRWATHGRVTERNAHPLHDCDGRISVVLNGIVENFRELRSGLESEGHRFASETDAETVAHLIERAYAGDLVDAVRDACSHLEGHFAFAAIHEDEPGLVVGSRRQCPLVVGLGDGEAFVASSISAFLGETQRVVLVEDGEIVAVTPDRCRVLGPAGEVARAPLVVDWDDEEAERQGYETYMLKEIHEQPEAVARTLAEHLHEDGLRPGALPLPDEELRRLERVVVISCGTSYHAGLVGRYLLEGLARLPCEVDIASEWRYRDPVVEPGSLVVGISQSGETADTIAAMRLARERGARTLAVTNMLGTQIEREVDATLHTRAGIEMGVAATKTFTAQVALLSVIALELAALRGTLGAAEAGALLEEVRSLPARIRAFLEGHHPITEIAARYADRRFFLYLGRHVDVPVCLEGALKLKEISYVPTEAYSAGEMKHGPIALLDERTPVVCVATDSHVYDKVVSNIEEVRARGARVIAIATDGNEAIQHQADEVVYVPRTHPLLSPLVSVLPLQLLAYEVARLHGLDVDRPRNLAKTVTVE